MKLAGLILLALLVIAVFISGCVREPAGPTTDPTTGPATGGLTQEQAEQKAFQTLDQEMDALEDMTLEELENELLQQG
jgi:PBP1b-binding outer membrane lipoprotein LpoB